MMDQPHRTYRFGPYAITVDGTSRDKIASNLTLFTPLSLASILGCLVPIWTPRTIASCYNFSHSNPAYVCTADRGATNEAGSGVWERRHQKRSVRFLTGRTPYRPCNYNSHVKSGEARPSRSFSVGMSPTRAVFLCTLPQGLLPKIMVKAKAVAPNATVVASTGMCLKFGTPQFRKRLEPTTLTWRGDPGHDGAMAFVGDIVALDVEQDGRGQGLPHANMKAVSWVTYVRSTVGARGRWHHTG